MENQKGKLFVFSAPSGTGKTTLILHVLKIFPELVFSISATTRAKRDYEIDGKDYFFISEGEFKTKIEKNEFIEWERFYGYYYGTLKCFINDQLKNLHSVVLEVDVKGALSIKKVYPESVLIFILPPSLEELKSRLKNRKTETDEDFKKRIERAEMELSFKEKFDYVVINENLEDAKENVRKIVKKELNKEL